MSAKYHCVYSDGSIARIPVETEHLWRYMDLWKLLSMLEHRALYLPVVASLDDRLEAVPPELPDGSTRTERWQQWHFWMQWRSTFFVSCWHNAQHESDAMWRAYAGRHQGIAIQSTFQALSDAFAPAGNDTPPAHLIKGGLVDYLDPDNRERMFRRGDGDRYILLKRSWFAYEKELRAAVEISDNYLEPEGPHQEGHYREEGIWVRCDLGTLIKRVVVAPRSPMFYETALRALLDKFGFDPNLVTLSQLNESFIPPDPTLLEQEWQRS